MILLVIPLEVICHYQLSIESDIMIIPKSTRIIMAMENDVTNDTEGIKRVSRYIDHKGKKCRFNGYEFEDGATIGVVREPGSNYVNYMETGDTASHSDKIMTIMARLRDNGLL